MDSIAVGYQATIPDGWHLRPNILSSETFRGDAYFKGIAPSNDPSRPATNITVGCQMNSDRKALDQAVNDAVETLTKLRREDVRVSDHASVGSLPARQVDYVFRIVVPTPQADPNIVLERRDVQFVSPSCIWTITLSAAQGQLAQDVPVLERFLSAFTVK